MTGEKWCSKQHLIDLFVKEFKADAEAVKYYYVLLFKICLSYGGDNSQLTYSFQFGLLGAAAAIHCAADFGAQLKDVAYKIVFLQLMCHAGTHNDAQRRVLMVDGPRV